MKQKIAFGALVLTLALIPGCIFSSDDDKEVKKGSVSGKITMVITGEPVANIKVMLVNRNAKIDTVDYTNNYRAFVDSTVTGSNGEFVLDGVAPGNYCVVPVNEDTTRVYKFTYATGSNSSGIAMNGDAHTVDFIAENTGYPGAEERKLTFTIYMTDIYNEGQVQYLVDSIEIYRRQWCDFVVKWVYMGGALPRREDGRLCFRIYAPMGFSDSVQSVENYFRIKVKYWNYAEMSDIYTAVHREKEFSIGYPLLFTPESSTWEFSITKGFPTHIEQMLSGTSRPVLSGITRPGFRGCSG